MPSEEAEPSRTPVTVPLVVLLEFGICTVTVVPIRLFACICDSDEDIALVCDSEVNCAICDAISVSDCGCNGSWFSICATKSCKKSFCVNVWFGFVAESVELWDAELTMLLYVEPIEEDADICFLVRPRFPSLDELEFVLLLEQTPTSE